MAENIGGIDPRIAREEAQYFAFKMAEIHRVVSTMPESVPGIPDAQEGCLVYLPASGIAVVQEKPSGYRSLVIKMIGAGIQLAFMDPISDTLA